MFNLSKRGWNKKSLDDVAYWYQRDIPDALLEKNKICNYVTSSHVKSDEIYLKNWASLDEDQKGPTITKHFLNGDLLFPTRSVALRKASIAMTSGVTGEKVLVLRLKDNSDLIPGLFPFVFRTTEFWDFANNTASGSVNKFTSWNKIKKYELSIPPKDVQIKLAELLHSANDSLEKDRTVFDSLKNLYHATFKEMLSGSTTAKEYIVKDILRELPKNGYSPKINSNGEGSKTVSISAIKNGLFDPSECTKTAVINPDVLDKYSIYEDDIFVIRGNGNKFRCAKAGIAKKDFNDYFYPDLLIRLRFKSDFVEPRFAALLWNSEKFHHNLIRRAKSTNGIWKINGDDVKHHKLFLPALQEQRCILKKLSSIETQLESSSTCIEHTKRFISALVDDIL